MLVYSWEVILAIELVYLRLTVCFSARLRCHVHGAPLTVIPQPSSQEESRRCRALRVHRRAALGEPEAGNRGREGRAALGCQAPTAIRREGHWLFPQAMIHDYSGCSRFR